MDSKTVLLFIALVLLQSAMLGARSIVPVEGTQTTIEVPGDHKTIQAAIDAANPRDIIQVASGVYNECITVNKQLTLVGEDSSTTFINSNGTYHVVHVNASYVHISGFTIQNGIFEHEPGYWSFFNGISLKNSNSTTITGNIITNNYYGILLENCSDAIIDGNTIVDNQYGIGSCSSDGNIISNNIISDNVFSGIVLHVDSKENIVSGNTVSDNENGVELASCCGNNTFYHNNFIDNTYQAASDGAVNAWDNGYPSGGNYWSDYDGIDSYGGPYQNDTGSDNIGDTSYVIDDDNQDRYPFMHQWPDSTSPTTTDDYDGQWHTTDFTVNLNATDDKSGVKATYYKINDGPTKTLSTDGQPFIATESANNKLEYWSIDKAGNEEIPHKILAEIKLDKTAPEGSIVISNGDIYTTSTSVTLTLTANDDTSGIYQVRYSNDGLWDTEPWETPSLTKTWTLTVGDGPKTVYYQVKDHAELVSSTYSDTIVLDTTLPTGSITINDGATYTMTTLVTLTLSATDVTSGPPEMRFSNDNTTYTEWQAYATTKSWTLQEGDGTKTVYVQFRDQVGLTSTYLDTIILDITPPMGSIVIAEGAKYTKSPSVILTIYADDAGSGVAQMRFSHDNTTWTPWETYAVSKAWALTTDDGEKTVYVQFKDNMGLISRSYSDSIFLDATKPSIGILFQEPPEGQVEPNQKVTVSVEVTDGQSGIGKVILQYRFSADGGQMWTMWTNVTMSETVGDIFVGEIPGFIAEIRVQYGIVAYDKAGNSATKDGMGQYFVYTVIPEFPAWIGIVATLCAFSAALILLRRKMQPSQKNIAR